MADVFLSYKRQDAERASEIAKDIMQEGVSVFFDQHIHVGEKWDVTIERELDAAKAVVVLWSPASRDSDWVKREAREGMRRRILCPAMIAECRVPLEFTDIQAADLRNHRSGARENGEWRRLIDAVFRCDGVGAKTVLREAEAPLPPPPVAPSPSQALKVRGSVIICPGFGEFIEKYFEVARELQRRGYATFCIDWRGQGLSGRELDNPLAAHFYSLDDPVNDLSLALRLFGNMLPRPHIGLAHSMGATILLRALQTRRVDIDGAAFLSPMWSLAYNVGVARLAARVGAGMGVALGAEKRWRKEPFKGNPNSDDRERHARSQGLVVEETRLAVAGPTQDWVVANAQAIDGFLQPRALGRVGIPCLVMSAGEDAVVANARHGEIAARLPNCIYLTIPGAKHELMMDTDEIRARVWRAFSLLTNQVAAAVH